MREPSSLTTLEAEGVARRFGHTFELGWKSLKDYLVWSGVVLQPVTPKETIRQAYAAKVIVDGQTWIDMLDRRNLLSHVYDERRFREALVVIARDFHPALQQAATQLAAWRGGAT